MKTYKYKINDQSNVIRLGNLIDDAHQVHQYFHRWQRQRKKDGLSYANYPAMCEHLTACKRTTHPHWNALPSQVLQEELKRISGAYQRYCKKQGGKPHIKPRHKFKSVTFRAQAGWKLSDNRITLTLRKHVRDKWQLDRVPYTFFKTSGVSRQNQNTDNQARQCRRLLALHRNRFCRYRTFATNR